ncbi:MAG: hypothetical protein MRY74_14795 [Neomegalonema sp.]|nr:hypothetical protein [Neomegalonema sp.]
MITGRTKLVAHIDSPTASFVGEVVMKVEETPLPAAAKARGGCGRIGLDMLFEQIPAYLEFFGFETASAQGTAPTGAD